MTENGRRIIRAWVWTLAVSLLVTFVLAILMAEPDPATRDSTTRTTVGLEE